MAERRLTAAAAPHEPPAPPGCCRIDHWSAEGWRPVAGFATQAEAEGMLAELRRRDPQALFRAVRRVDVPPEPAPPPLALPELHIDRMVHAARTPPERVGRSLARLGGTLGLVGLVALACAARWSASGAPELTSRSAAAAPEDTSWPAEPGRTEGIIDATPATPAVLAGRWSASGGDCSLGETRFLIDRELRVAGDGSRRTLAVAGYFADARNLVRIAYAGGATAVYAAEAGRLTLARARIAGIDIDPQQPLVLERCAGGAAAAADDAPPGRLANTLSVAFRLAVQVGDDLAATLALAHGMRPTESLGEGLAQTPLAWAVGHGRAVLVGKLVAAGADPDAVDADGATLLSQAVRRGDVAVVEALLAAGADPEQRDRDGRRPIEIAAALDHQLLVDVLFAAR